MWKLSTQSSWRTPLAKQVSTFSFVAPAIMGIRKSLRRFPLEGLLEKASNLASIGRWLEDLPNLVIVLIVKILSKLLAFNKMFCEAKFEIKGKSTLIFSVVEKELRKIDVAFS